MWHKLLSVLVAVAALCRLKYVPTMYPATLIFSCLAMVLAIGVWVTPLASLGSPDTFFAALHPFIVNVMFGSSIPLQVLLGHISFML